VGGVLVDDIEAYGRTCELLTTLRSSEERLSTLTQGWGASATSHTLTSSFLGGGIAGDASRFVLCRLTGCSVLSQHRYFPLGTAGIVIELQLDDADAAFEGTGNQWHIDSCRLLADVVTLDSAMSNNFQSLLNQGQSLPFPCRGVYSMV
jgi:hypothetical protein